MIDAVGADNVCIVMCSSRRNRIVKIPAKIGNEMTAEFESVSSNDW